MFRTICTCNAGGIYVSALLLYVCEKWRTNISQCYSLLDIPSCLHYFTLYNTIYNCVASYRMTPLVITSHAALCHIPAGVLLMVSFLSLHLKWLLMVSPCPSNKKWETIWRQAQIIHLTSTMYSGLLPCLRGNWKCRWKPIGCRSNVQRLCEILEPLSRLWSGPSLKVRYLSGSIVLWPLLLTWFNFNPSMDK